MIEPQSYLDGKVLLYPGDCMAVLGQLPENSVDSVVVDPPYHLTRIVKRFGNSNPADVEKNATGRKIAGQGTSPHGRAAAGFMGKQWDGGDIAFQPSTWAAVLRVLKPGGYILAFASTRGFGRMSVAIEDAGFITHPLIAWIFGSGLPKATRIKAEGYEGFRYGGQALKPAIEPIYMGQKPFSEATGTANILCWGTGAVNVDGCRVDSHEVTGWGGGAAGGNTWTGDNCGLAKAGDARPVQGRWPANIIHDGSDEVLAGFPDAGKSSGGGGLKTSAGLPDTKAGGHFYDGNVGFGDSGSAARFFYAVEKEERCDLCRVLLGEKYAKDSPCAANIATPTSSTQNTQNGDTVRADAAALRPREGEASSPQLNGHARNAESHSSGCRQPISGTAPSDALISETSRIARNVKSAANLCDSCATDIAQSLAATRLGLDPASLPCLESMPERRRQILRLHLALYVADRENTDTITTTASLKTFFGSVFHAIASTTNSERSASTANTEAVPSRLFYSSKADADDRIGSKHPTVKPVDLAAYLCRLITPPGGTVLDCFAGTGTTGEAAWREGFKAILIEREPEYQADIARRMDLVLKPTKRAAVAKTKNNLQGAEGTPLFGGEAA